MDQTDKNIDRAMGLELGDYCRISVNSLFAQQIFSQALRLQPTTFDPQILEKLRSCLENKVSVFQRFEDLPALDKKNIVTRLISVYVESKQIIFESDTSIINSGGQQAIELSDATELRMEILSSIQNFLMNLANKVNVYGEFADKLTEVEPLAVVRPRIPTIPYGLPKHVQKSKVPFDPAKATTKPTTGVTQDLDLGKIVANLKDSDKPVPPKEEPVRQFPEQESSSGAISILPPPPPESQRGALEVVIPGEEDERILDRFRKGFWEMINTRSPEIFIPERLEQAIRNVAMMTFVNISGEPATKVGCKSYAERKAKEGKNSSDIAFELAIRILKKDAREWVEKYLEKMMEKIIKLYEKNGLKERLNNITEKDLDSEVAQCASFIFKRLECLLSAPGGANARPLMYYFLANTNEQAQALYKLIYEILYIRSIDLRSQAIKEGTQDAVSDVLEKAPDPGDVAAEAGQVPLPQFESREMDDDEIDANQDLSAILAEEAAPQIEIGELFDLVDDDDDEKPVQDNEDVTGVYYVGPQELPKRAAKQADVPGVLIEGKPAVMSQAKYEVVIGEKDASGSDMEMVIIDGHPRVGSRVRPAAGRKVEPTGAQIKPAPDADISNNVLLQKAESAATEKEAVKISQYNVPTMPPPPFAANDADIKSFWQKLTSNKYAKVISVISAMVSWADVANELYDLSANFLQQDEEVAAASAVTSVASAPSAYVEPQKQLKPVTQPKAVNEQVSAAQSSGGVKMNVEMEKIPQGQKLARSLIEKGVYPEGFADKDHASKLLFIFGQNLSDAERVQIDELRNQYNRGAYANVIASFRGKSNAEMWAINNNPSNPLHQQLKNAQQSLGEKDWTKWSWEVKKLVKEDGKLVFKKIPYEQAYADDMNFYRQCRGEFVQMGLYGNNATINGKMSTFASRLVMIRHWGLAVSDAPAVPAPPADLLQGPDNQKPADLELPENFDGGAEIKDGGDIHGMTTLPAEGVKTTMAGITGCGARNTVESNFFMTKEQQCEFDMGWDANEETQCIDTDEPQISVSEEYAELAPLAVEMRTSCVANEEINAEDHKWFAEGEKISEKNIAEEAANRQWVAAYPEWYPDEPVAKKPGLLARAASSIKEVFSPSEKTAEEKEKTELQASVPKKSLWRNFIG